MRPFSWKPSRRSAAIAVTICLLAFLAGWIGLMLSIGPDALVEALGARNGYLIAFLIAAAGGFSLFTAAGLTATLITLSAGGLNPFLLGAVAGVGITIGDSAYYYLAKKGLEAMPENDTKARAERFAAWLSQQPRFMLPFVIFVYIGLTPLPNELLAVSLAIAQVRYRHIVPALLLGNVTLATGLSLVGVIDADDFFF